MRALPAITPRTAATLILLTVICTGCRSSSRWASLNPWSSGDQETSIAARSAPELPTAQASNPGGVATVASGTANQEAPAFTPSTPAAAPPSTAYPTTGLAAASGEPTPPSLPAYPSTNSNSYAAAAPAASPAAPATAPMAGPYDPNGYAPSAETVASSAPADRYGDSRYAPSEGLPLAGMPPVSNTSPGATSGGRYGEIASDLPGLPPASDLPGLPGLPPTAGLPPSGGLPIETRPTVSQTAGQAAPVTTSPGGYRPGGTSNYEVSVALRTAPPSTGASPAPAANSASGAAPAGTQGYPTTESYRY